jgi:hypothetical protein
MLVGGNVDQDLGEEMEVIEQNMEEGCVPFQNAPPNQNSHNCHGW